MREIIVIKKENVRVNFGRDNDPERIVKIVGNIPHQLDTRLDPSYFATIPRDDEPWWSRRGIAAWPKGEVVANIAVVSFEESFPDFEALYQAVEEENYGHLLFPWLTLVPAWADKLYKAGIFWVVVSDPNSLRREIGGLEAPCFDCRPDYRWLGSRWVGHDWSNVTGVLVDCGPEDY